MRQTWSGSPRPWLTETAARSPRARGPKAVSFCSPLVSLSSLVQLDVCQISSVLASSHKAPSPLAPSKSPDELRRRRRRRSGARQAGGGGGVS